MDHEAAGGRGALWAWLVLVAAVTLLNIGTVMFVDVPADRIYRYSTTVLALLQFGLMLAVVGVIARAGGLREVLALRAPSSWLHAAAVGAVVFIGTVLLLVSWLHCCAPETCRDCRPHGIRVGRFRLP
jgi:hypothetical protein